MQEYRLFAIKDVKTGTFSQLMYGRTIGEVERELVEHMRDGVSRYAKFHHDFILYEVATYDDTVGLPVPLDAPYCIGSLTAYLTTPIVN